MKAVIAFLIVLVCLSSTAFAQAKISSVTVSPESFIIGKTTDSLIVSARYVGDDKQFSLSILDRDGVELYSDSEGGNNGIVSFTVIQEDWSSFGTGSFKAVVSAGDSQKSAFFTVVEQKTVNVPDTSLFLLPLIVLMVLSIVFFKKE